MLKKDRLAIIRKWYPNAISTIDSVNSLIDFVEERLELEPAQIMLADSICSDDVNSIQYPSRAGEFLGPFKMGGLDGYPFTGLTGMGAFASHVPDNGAVLIYYGPHIGITKAGTIGEINRFGQSRASGCCGAAKAALARLIKGEIEPGRMTDLDYQMNTIEQILFSQRERVLGADTPLLQATEVIYEATEMRINELTEQTKYNCKYLIVVGAILINSDSDMGSYTSIQRFEVINLVTGERQDHISFFEALVQ